ncbi:MAG: NAD(P)/FAD-dependent oxidoreductase, partial [Acidobacteriota bacterium]
MSRTGTGQTPPEKIRPRRPKHWSRTSPEGPWDYVVIGSGMGGLTAAAMLAKLGRRVLVLEQHYVPGGFTHAFTRKGYTWDVGVHAIGEVTQHSFPGRLLHRLTDGRLRWGSLGSVYEEFHFPDLRIDFPDSPQAFRNNLVAAFPDEEEAIDRYLALVREVSGGMRSYYLGRAVPRWLGPVGKLMERSAQEHLNVDVRTVIDGLTDDPRLRAVLTAQWGYYGVSPSRASFAVQALVAKHYLHGGFYPVGGSSSIARELTRTVEDCGGWTRILADVEEIIVRGGRAVGVRLVGGEEILARRVVSAAGVLATVERMLPASVTEKTWAASARRLTPGPAHVCLYLGFKGDIAREGASGANKWFYGTWSQEGEEAWRVDGPEIGPAPVLYCSFPSMKDPEHDPG